MAMQLHVIADFSALNKPKITIMDQNKILDLLTNEELTPVEQFNAGVRLLVEAGAHDNIVRSYNMRGFTAQNLETLKYDLRQLIGYSEFQVKQHGLKKPKAVDVVRTAEELAPVLEENQDLFTELLEKMQDQEKDGFAISAMYPFLREKDCPNELKVLVNDKITAYVNFKEAHKELLDKVANVAEPKLSEAEIYELAKTVVDDFLLNKEIEAELEYYKTNKQILGDHEIFADLKLEREISKLSPAELATRSSNLKTYISRTKTAKKSAKKPEKIAELEEKLVGYEKEKVLVDAELAKK